MTIASQSFADFGVEEPIVDALSAAGISTPFPIQELTLPLALSGADIIGQARTGTGKTLAFGIPLLQRVDPDAAIVQALVIVPTRELCLQVTGDLNQAGLQKGVDVVAAYGGRALEPQAQAIADGAPVVVGTPGRLLDLMRRGSLRLGEVRTLVLDEADEMLDLGFLPDVEQMIQATNADRQTMLFSATMPSAVVALARRYMRKPTFLRTDVEEVHVAPETQQYFFSCHRMDKSSVLARILQDPTRNLCLVFSRTKRMADILTEELRAQGVAAAAIHSDLRQEARERALTRFRSGKIDVLVATEVAARGLDISNVSHVVNYDTPDDEKMYLHRIGRTGRAGAAGVAITLSLWNELARVEMIKRALDLTEPTHEVFSTSPLLDELFHLPPRTPRGPVVLDDDDEDEAALRPAPAAPTPTASAQVSGPASPEDGDGRRRRRGGRRKSQPAEDAAALGREPAQIEPVVAPGPGPQTITHEPQPPVRIRRRQRGGVDVNAHDEPARLETDGAGRVPQAPPLDDAAAPAGSTAPAVAPLQAVAADTADAAGMAGGAERADGAGRGGEHRTRVRQRGRGRVVLEPATPQEGAHSTGVPAPPAPPAAAPRGDRPGTGRRRRRDERQPARGVRREREQDLRRPPVTRDPHVPLPVDATAARGAGKPLLRRPLAILHLP